MKRDESIHPLYRVLIIGVGSIGERHTRCFVKCGRALVSICEPNERLRHDVGEKYGIANRFADLESALSHSFDAAVIAVPADLHIPVAQKAVDNGLHVLIEKPLAVTLDGVDELQSSVERTSRIAAVGYVYRAHPALRAMRNAIRSDTFGRPVQLCVVAGQNFPTYRPAYLESYYINHARGGGAIQDAMTHLVNASEWLVGTIDRLVADADHQLLTGTEVEDVVNLLARHNGVLASYTLNQYQSPNEIVITVVCERGTARFEYHRSRWRFMVHPDEPWHDEPALGLDRDTLFVNQADAFLDSIEKGAAPLCSLEEAIQSLRVNLAIFRSLQDRSWHSVRQVSAHV